MVEVSRSACKEGEERKKGTKCHSNSLESQKTINVSMQARQIVMNVQLSLSCSLHEVKDEAEDNDDGHLGLHDALHVGGPAVLGGHDTAGRGNQPEEGRRGRRE